MLYFVSSIFIQPLALFPVLSLLSLDWSDLPSPALSCSALPCPALPTALPCPAGRPDLTCPDPPPPDLWQEATATSIEFSIPAPADHGGVPVNAFLVQYVEQSKEWSASQDSEWTAQGPFLLRGLKPEHTYRFR